MSDMPAKDMKVKAEQGELTPELAWQHDYGMGLVSFTWEAVRRYGMDPVVPVDAAPQVPYAGLSRLVSGHPSFNVLIIAPEEENTTLAGLHTVYSINKGANTLAVRPERINTTLAYPVTKHDDKDKHRKFFNQVFKGQEDIIESNLARSDGFKRLLAYTLAADCGKGAAKGLEHYCESLAGFLPLEKQVLSGVVQVYRKKVEANIRPVFIPEHA